MTDTLSIRHQFTVAERQLLLKLINLFTKYPEIDWSCRIIAQWWKCSERAVRYLMEKLRSLGWIHEAWISCRECVRTASETLMNLKEKIMATCRVRAGCVPDNFALKNFSQPPEDEGIGTETKSPPFINKYNNKEVSTYNKDSEIVESILAHPKFTPTRSVVAARRWFLSNPKQAQENLLWLLSQAELADRANLLPAISLVLSRMAPKQRSAFGRSGTTITCDTRSGSLYLSESDMFWQPWLLRALNQLGVANPDEIISVVEANLNAELD